MDLDININPNQQQPLPGTEQKMDPIPIHDNPEYIGSGKLKDKVAIITGADSGIGKAVAIAFAKEGAKIVAAYLNEDEDAQDTKAQIEKYNGQCILVKGDLSISKMSESIINQTIEKFGKLDILVNHAGEQYQTNSLQDVTDESLGDIFKVNVFSMFYLTREALKHMKKGAAIINTVSVVAYKGNPMLLDYSSTKGANLAFTRALAASLASKGIRVNAVAPGPIWTPLIPASFSQDKLKEFGKDTPMGRMGQPFELAPAYVYLASEIDSSYVTGQVLHVNGGTPVNS
ncbi:MAG: short-chain dehydrogenase/reductase [Burkholderiales bacterium]|jgi:NAD(P)-dependent dehydrogenase (short-subunit alcohol dehydrogenase family)|nr:short-chain dehydrogenase/reductase [Burkholderiales bacterium]